MKKYLRYTIIVGALILSLVAIDRVFVSIKAETRVENQSEEKETTLKKQNKKVTKKIKNANKFIKKKGKTYYRDENGKKVKGKIYEVKRGKSYYFDKKGVVQKGWDCQGDKA